MARALSFCRLAGNLDSPSLSCLRVQHPSSMLSTTGGDRSSGDREMSTCKMRTVFFRRTDENGAPFLLSKRTSSRSKHCLSFKELRRGQSYDVVGAKQETNTDRIISPSPSLMRSYLGCKETETVITDDDRGELGTVVGQDSLNMCLPSDLKGR